RHIVTVSEELYLKLGLLVSEPVALAEFLSDSMVVSESIKYQMRPEVPGTVLKPPSSKKFSNLSFTGIPLYATTSHSFPPFEAVCLYGDKRIEEWLQSLGLGRHDYWHQSLDELREEYYWVFQERSEFYTSDADVIVGGWPQRWSDECYPPQELRLLFFTQRDAEPWFEAWYSPVNETCYAKSRIT
ncbi:MAG TPA: hypothetical protein VN625_01875, partial [Desulfuromonadaceae bacterium]|nr:hypothetical protein [Desulfuromonadaceae bacterium]